MRELFSQNIREYISIEQLSSQDVETVSDLIRQSLNQYEDFGSVLASSYRRIERLWENFNQEGARYFVARTKDEGRVIGGAGLGPLAGLPLTEGIAQIRELVICPEYRGQGIGGHLVYECLMASKSFEYQTIYLETTPQMQIAQKLFSRFGFRPVTHSSKAKTFITKEESHPNLFVLEDIEEGLRRGARSLNISLV